MKGLFYILLLLSLGTALQAQRSAVESLKEQIRSNSESLTPEVMYELGKAYRPVNADSSIYFLEAVRDSELKLQDPELWTKALYYLQSAYGRIGNFEKKDV